MTTSILLVDDDLSICQALGRELTRRGYRVLVAHAVEDAFQKLIENRATRPIDVVVTDLRLEGWNGLDLLRELHRLSPITRSVLMSGFASAKDHDVARSLGAVAVLSKPFAGQDLVRAIEKAVACQTTLHGDVHGLTLVDLLQLFHQTRRSLTLSFSGPIQGEVHLVDGEVVDAAAAGLRGESALRELLRTPSGFFRTSPPQAEAERTIERPLTSLLLDLLKQIDEGGESRR